VGKRKPVTADAEFFDEGAVLIELEEARLAAPCEREDVPLEFVATPVPSPM
jgi:hypothetical protein